jgi:hypothetical protein
MQTYAMQTSVHGSQKINLRRPVARTASSRADLTRGDVHGRVDDRHAERLTARSVETAFFMSSSWSIDLTAASCSRW